MLGLQDNIRKDGQDLIRIGGLYAREYDWFTKEDAEWIRTRLKETIKEYENANKSTTEKLKEYGSSIKDLNEKVRQRLNDWLT